MNQKLPRQMLPHIPTMEDMKLSEPVSDQAEKDFLTNLIKITDPQCMTLIMNKQLTWDLALESADFEPEKVKARMIERGELERTKVRGDKFSSPPH